MKKMLILLMILASSQLYAAPNCVVPTDIEGPISVNLKKACLPDAYFLKAPVSDLSMENIIRGPDIKEVAFKSEETVYCRYFYRPQNGSSNKFRCYRTNELKQFMNDKGQVVPEAVSVGNGELEEVLLNAQKKPILNAKGKPQKADILKVRFQNGSRRHRENFSSTVASRMSWIMGVPMENYYSVNRVTCFGCEKNPWKEGKALQLKPIEGIQNDFMYASIERKYEAKRIMKPNVVKLPNGRLHDNIPWKWADFGEKIHLMPKDQRVEFEVLALITNFLQVMEHRGSQHLVLCEDEYYDKTTRVCSKALAAIHDMGSAFGNRITFYPAESGYASNHPRADFDGYKKVKMFKDGTCEMNYNKPGLKPFLAESFAEFRNRLKLLSPEIVKELLREAYFEHADLPFRASVKAQNPNLPEEKLNELILQKWTDLIMSKIKENLNANC